jgi:hypothetical protein
MLVYFQQRGYIMSRVVLAVVMLVAWSFTLAGNQNLLAQPPRTRVESRQERRDDRKYGATSEIRRVSSIIGGTVFVQGDVSVGKIEDIVLSEDGCVDYLVVMAANKYVLVPWSVARFDFERRTAVIEIGKEKFQEVPTFTRDRWPTLDSGYVEKLYTFYGARPGQERRIERRERERRR